VLRNVLTDLPGNLGLLQQYRHRAAEPECPHSRRVLDVKRTWRRPRNQSVVASPTA
jgi:hypothetical protein